MKFSSTALNLCAALAASALTAVVQADEHQVIIGLGSKRPEGTHALSAADVSALGLDAGNYMLVSEAFFGGAKLVNVDTYEVSNLIESGPFGARGGIGINYDSASQTVVSCGGGPVIGTVAAIHLGDATTGQHVKSCTLPDGTTPGFLNDLEVIDGIAYITDSGFPRLWSLDIAAALDDENCTLTMEAGLDPDIFSATAEAPFASNGIVSYETGFFISQFSLGGVYFVGSDGATIKQLIAPEDAPAADGMELVDEGDGTFTLYITQGTNEISAFTITPTSEGPTATLSHVLTSDDFDSSATAAVLGDWVYACNLRVNTAPLGQNGENDPDTFSETFSVVGLPRIAPVEEAPSEAPTEDPGTEAHSEAPTSLLGFKNVITGTIFGLLGCLVIFGN